MFSTVNGLTVLHAAAIGGNLKIVKHLADNLEDTNPAMNLKMTPLHFAAQAGNSEVFKYLVQNLKNKNPTTTDGFTPLHLASCHGQVEVITALLAAGADKTIKCYRRRTPHDWAKNGDTRNALE